MPTDTATKYRMRDTKHFAAKSEFVVIEELEYDFRGRGKKLPAVRIKRQGVDGGEVLLTRAEFDNEFEAVPNTAANPKPETRNPKPV